MKTIADGFVNLINTERVVSATSIIRNNRLTFDTGTYIDADKRLSTYYSYDSDNYDHGVLRIAVTLSGGIYVLAYQYIDDPFADPSTWNSFVTSAIEVPQRCKPAVFQNRVYYMKVNGDFAYRDYNCGTGLLGAETVFGITGNPVSPLYKTGFAPVSLTEVYVIEISLASGTNYAIFSCFEAIDSVPVEVACPRVAYGEMGTYYNFGFDAVRAGNEDHIFFSSGKLGNRIDYIVRDSQNWSRINPVLDLDVTDGEAKFLLNSVNLINDRIFVSMEVIRDGGTEMVGYESGNFCAYTMGPAPYTFGRDTYVKTSSFASVYNWKPEGKILCLETEIGGVPHIGFLNMMSLYLADSIYFTGYDNASYKLALGGIDEIIIDHATNNPSSLQLYVGGVDKDNALVAPGNEIEIYAKLDDQSALMGLFGIDAVLNDRRQDGQSKSVTARSLGFKRLSMWTSDAYYDLWSQTKQTCNPSELTEVIRMSGNWSTDDIEGTSPIRLDELNEPGILYSAEMSTKSNIGRACFCKSYAPSYTPKFGVMANVYRHPTTDEDKDLVYSGFLALVDDVTAYLYYIHENTWELLTSSVIDFTWDVWTWLEITYIDGWVSLKRKDEGQTEWVEVIAPFEFKNSAYAPFASIANTGRPGIYIENVTPNSLTTGFGTEDMIIPVDDSSVYALPCTVIADNEQISIGSQGAIATGFVGDKEVVDGQTFMSAPHNNAYWINGVVTNIPVGDVEADQELCRYSQNRVLSWSIRPGGVITADGIQIRVKKVGSPAGKLYAFLANDNWDNSSALNWDAVLAHGEIDASAIGTDYAWITITFGSPAVDLPIDNYFLALTNVDEHFTPTADASNYYLVGVDEYTPFSEGYTFLWDGPGFINRDPNAKPAYKLMGEGNGGDGYEIYIDGPSEAHDRNYFDDNALVVKEGPGVGAVFKITDYDYQAPAQWIPSQYYVPPDRWQDHVGDLAHGAWVNPDAARIFVETNPSGSIAPGSILSIKGGLVVTARGVNSTVATSHGAVKVSQYTSTSVLCNGFEYFSMDVDKRICDIAKDICRKSGVWNFTDEKLCDESLTMPGSYGTEVLTDFFDHRNLIIRLKPITDEGDITLSLAYHFTANFPPAALSDFSEGRRLDITASSIKIYRMIDPTGSPDELLIQRAISIPLNNQWLTISIQENYVSIWYMDELILAFYDDFIYGGVGNYAWIQSTWLSGSAPTFYVDWSACDRRIDNFTIDQGSRGAQLLGTLIGKKRYYIIDTVDGGIKLFNNSTTIPDVYTLTATAGTGTLEMDLATRMRVQGLYEKELIDHEAMRLYGNIYIETNNEDIETEAEGTYDADKTLTELIRRHGKHTLIGAADPRVEPRDLITYSLDGGSTSTQVMVDSATFTIAFVGDNPIFDMKLEAFDA